MNAFLRLTSVTLFALALSACGGGGDSSAAAGGGDTPTTPVTPDPVPSAPAEAASGPAAAAAALAAVPGNLSGVAAVGAPLANAIITLKCLGSPAASFVATADGSFKVSAKSASFPCVIRAQGVGSQASHTFHSIALAPGVVNITPVTDAVLALLADDLPKNFFDTLTDVQIASVSRARLDAALARLSAVLPPGIVLPAGRDPFTAPFKADGVDAMDRVLDSIKVAMAAENLSWADAIEFVLAEEVIGTTEPVLGKFGPLSGPSGTAVTITGKNFPVSPVPRIALVSASGVRTPAAVQAGNSSASLTFTVPNGLAAGSYSIDAAGYVLPLTFYVVVPNPAAADPYYKTGPTHNLIYTSLMSTDDALRANSGVVIHYPGRVRTAEQCFVRINSDQSVSELDKDGKVIRIYEWENRSKPLSADYPTLYATDPWNGPDRSYAVKIVQISGSVNAPAFLFGVGGFTDTFRMCISASTDANTFQFFVGPAIANWAKADGEHQGAGLMVYENVDVVLAGTSLVYQRLDEKTLPYTIRALKNLTVTATSKCKLTVTQGSVTMTVDGSTVGSYNVSDSFRYEPPPSFAEFNTPYFDLVPVIPKESNFRLLSYKPYLYVSQPDLVLDLGLPGGYANWTNYVTVFYGVSNYGAKPGGFDYQGTLSCFLPGGLPAFNGAKLLSNRL